MVSPVSGTVSDLEVNLAEMARSAVSCGEGGHLEERALLRVLRIGRFVAVEDILEPVRSTAFCPVQGKAGGRALERAIRAPWRG